MKTQYRHTPVLLSEALEYLALKPGMTYCDCTLGLAGHAAAAARAIAPGGLLIGIDQDDSALEYAGKRLKEDASGTRIRLVKSNFGDLDAALIQTQVPGIDAFLFDLGVSSPQLDISDRGFSYHADAPLDMRMDPSTQTLNAAEVIATYSVPDLTRVLTEYGEEKWASRIAHFIARSRQRAEIKTSSQLVKIVKDAIPASARRSGPHPARRTFQALRIEVNDEMGALRRGIEAAIRWTKPHGRIAVISYHSLEDRIVKDAFRAMENRCTCPPDLAVCACGRKPILKVLTKRPICAGSLEVGQNPRSRSAKLRVAERLEYGLFAGASQGVCEKEGM